MTSPALWPWPAPVDDGAARHLVAGTSLPDLTLPSSQGGDVNLARVPGRSVVVIYPWTGRPGVANPPGWDDIAGAHGSTPQLEGLRDQHSILTANGVSVFALSGQDAGWHAELAERLGLPFAVVSDANLSFADALGVPTFETGGQRYYKRSTLIVADGAIVSVIYPVHPPDRHAAQLVAQFASA